MLQSVDDKNKDTENTSNNRSSSMPDPQLVLPDNISLPIKFLFFIISGVFGTATGVTVFKLTQKSLLKGQHELQIEVSGHKDKISDLEGTVGKINDKQLVTGDSITTLTDLVHNLHFDRDNNPKLLTINQHKEFRDNFHEFFGLQLKLMRSDISDLKTQSTEVLSRLPKQ